MATSKDKGVNKRIGNQFWKLRSKHGRKKLFETPELLWEAACEYFQWCDDNPLIENKPMHYQGVIVPNPIEKMRAYTLTGLALYLGCSAEYLRNFKQNNKDADNFMSVITCIKETMYTQKFSGAAADLLNPNIIARDLGLVDKKENKSEVEVTAMGSREEIKAALNDILGSDD